MSHMSTSIHCLPVRRWTGTALLTCCKPTLLWAVRTLTEGYKFGVTSFPRFRGTLQHAPASQKQRHLLVSVHLKQGLDPISLRSPGLFVHVKLDCNQVFSSSNFLLQPVQGYTNPWEPLTWGKVGAAMPLCHLKIRLVYWSITFKRF